jgi:hypothetical protein
MIPSAVIAIPHIPLSNSGKVDKAALKKLLAARSPMGQGSLPEDGLEAEIAALWSELLGRGPIHRDDNFFALGGHSLLAIAVAHRLEKALGHPVPARALFVEPTLRGFAHRVRHLGKAALPQAVLSDRATEGQREFWIAQQAGLDTRGFNLALTLTVTGQAEACPTAWVTLVARHDALRTGFHEDEAGVLRRSTLPELSADLEISAHADMPAALAHIRERQAEPFRMERPPLWRAGLAQVGDQRVFWLALHHSVGDGVSLGVLAEELSTLIEGETLSPIADRFDHSAGQGEIYLSGPACQEDARYWREILGRAGRFGDLSTNGPWISRDRWDVRRGTQKEPTASGSAWTPPPPPVCAILRTKNGASLHALMLTIMAQEVRRRTGRSEFLLGTAASTRDSVSEARIVGYYVNMLPVPCRVDSRESVERAIESMQRSLAEGLQHARYPFARMYRDFPAHPARYPRCSTWR